jgi:phosphate transport system ATP-binding protein
MSSATKPILDTPVAAANAVAVQFQGVSLFYGTFRAVKDVSLDFRARAITAIIGPSGCGKSTLLRSINRINDRVPRFRVEGTIALGTQSIYAPEVDVVRLRRRVGMVFQKPNPFPQSIYDNVAFGMLLYERVPRKMLNERVEQALRDAVLWDEVKDKLNQSALGLSGGQQQRLCIARAIATEPEVLLMDEPCSALDPISTLRIEELLVDLKRNYTILIVTHNMQQASRVSDFTVMMSMDPDDQTGYVVEVGDTEQLFLRPQQQQTEAYITGKFG